MSTKSGTRLFIAALLITPHQSIIRKIKTVEYSYMENYLALKKELLMHLKWASRTLGWVKETRCNKSSYLLHVYWRITFTWNPGRGKTNPQWQKPEQRLLLYMNGEEGWERAWKELLGWWKHSISRERFEMHACLRLPKLMKLYF